MYLHNSSYVWDGVFVKFILFGCNVEPIALWFSNLNFNSFECSQSIVHPLILLSKKVKISFTCSVSGSDFWALHEDFYVLCEDSPITRLCSKNLGFLKYLPSGSSFRRAFSPLFTARSVQIFWRGEKRGRGSSRIKWRRVDKLFRCCEGRGGRGVGVQWIYTYILRGRLKNTTWSFHFDFYQVRAQVLTSVNLWSGTLFFCQSFCLHIAFQGIDETSLENRRSTDSRSKDFNDIQTTIRSS